MLRNYVAVALRVSVHPAVRGRERPRPAVGICAALLAAIVIHSEHHYDVFIPGYERTYLIVGISNPTPGRRLFYGDETNGRLAKLLQLQAPGIEATARTAKPETPTQEVFLRRGDIEASEPIYWADPAIFRVLPFPVVAGNLATALERPDAIVLTRSLARKYFGREMCSGRRFSGAQGDTCRDGGDRRPPGVTLQSLCIPVRPRVLLPVLLHGSRPDQRKRRPIPVAAGEAPTCD